MTLCLTELEYDLFSDSGALWCVDCAKIGSRAEKQTALSHFWRTHTLGTTRR